MKRVLLLLLLISNLGWTQVSSNLPLIIIDTEGNTIVDEPKVGAQMKIINNGEGQLNRVEDNPYYTGRIGIEFRGSSSQSFPKKPFGIETWDSEGMDIDTSLFDWPSESDYVLFASYHEKSLIHNVLTLRMAEQMGLYASRTKYVELYLNGQYQGIYVFMEKVKRDKGRVDIAKLEPDENSGEDLTGGYIIKVDKNTGTNFGSWESEFFNVENPHYHRTRFFYEYPKSITSTQRNYIRNYISDFEKALYGSDFLDSLSGYRTFIKVKTFISYMLVNEVSKNVDGYRISTFLYKDKNEELAIGPPWDFDISYGNANYCDGWKYTGFSYKFSEVCPQDGYSVPFWWNRFFEDPEFIADLRTEYDQLRTDGILKDENILALIDELANEIKDAQVRNFQKWNILGTYVWPDNSHPPTWEGEVNELKIWLIERLKWLDANIPRALEITGPLALQKEFDFTAKAYPNPFIGSLSLIINSKDSDKAVISLTDLLGREIETRELSLQKGENRFNLRFPENHSTQTLQLLRITVGEQQMIQKVARN